MPAPEHIRQHAAEEIIYYINPEYKYFKKIADIFYRMIRVSKHVTFKILFRKVLMEAGFEQFHIISYSATDGIYSQVSSR